MSAVAQRPAGAQGGGVSHLTPAQIHQFGRTLNVTLWAVTGLVCVFSLVNVHDIASSHGTGDPEAWLLAPIVDIALIAALRADSVLSVAGESPGRWAAALRWTAGISTWVLNVWDSVFPAEIPVREPSGAVKMIAAGVDPGAILTHSVPPLILILLAEAAVAYRRKFADLAGDGEGQALAVAQDAARQAQAELVTVSAERAQARTELAAAAGMRDQLAEALAQTAQRAEQHQAAVDTAQARLAETERELAAVREATSDADALREDRDRLARAHQDATDALSAAQAEGERLSSQLAAVKATGKGAGRTAGLSGWTGDASSEELTVLAAVLDSIQLRRTGKGMTYSAAQSAMGIRYDAAKAALQAAREGRGKTPPAPTVIRPDDDIADAEILPMPSPRELDTASAGGAR